MSRIIFEEVDGKYELYIKNHKIGFMYKDDLLDKDKAQKLFNRVAHEYIRSILERRTQSTTEGHSIGGDIFDMMTFGIFKK